jgi:hypothetical protein
MKTTNNYFNLNEFKNGKTATTKLGNPVKFICITADGKLLVNVNHRSRIIGFSSKTVAPVFEGSIEKYNLDGHKYRGTETEFDLVMEAPKRPRNSKGQFIKMS